MKQKLRSYVHDSLGRRMDRVDDILLYYWQFFVTVLT
jgi:hypothetical protein